MCAKPFLSQKCDEDTLKVKKTSRNSHREDVKDVTKMVQQKTEQKVPGNRENAKNVTKTQWHKSKRNDHYSRTLLHSHCLHRCFNVSWRFRIIGTH